MKVLLCIDDTDNLESIGTGEMLQNICKELQEKDWATEGFVSRHQLFIHESIRYTSHNSSMCCELEDVKEENIEKIIAFTGDYLAKNAAEGSDPGLCLVRHEDLLDNSALVAYGRRAKKEVLTKQIAYDFAAHYPKVIHLSEHGGTGDGVIGALAGCGLRISGNDGNVKGKLMPKTPNELLSVSDFCREYNISQVLTMDWQPLSEETMIIFADKAKPFMRDGQTSVLVKSCTGMQAPWMTVSQSEIKEMGVGR